MKLAAKLFSRFRTVKSDQPDAFELRLTSMGGIATHTRRGPVPTLFHRGGTLA